MMLVELFKFESKYILCPLSTDKKGLRVPVEPFREHPINTSLSELADSILKLLPSSSDTWPPDPGMADQSRKLLRLAGVKKASQFDPVAIVTVDRSADGSMQVVPSGERRRAGISGGRPIKMRRPITLRKLTRALGKAIRESERW